MPDKKMWIAENKDKSLQLNEKFFLDAQISIQLCTHLK